MPLAFKVVLELGRNGKMGWFKLYHVTFLPTQLFQEVRPKEDYQGVHFSPRLPVPYLSFPLHSVNLTSEGKSFYKMVQSLPNPPQGQSAQINRCERKRLVTSQGHSTELVLTAAFI